jgi:hypothetical protein
MKDNREMEMIHNKFKGQKGLVPQFPGLNWSTNMTIEQVRNFIKNQKKSKGFFFTLPTGTTTEQIQLSGDARVLLGYNLIAVADTSPLTPSAFPREVTLQVNNEVIDNKAHGYFFSNFLKDEEYASRPRPLDGQDDITLTFNNVELDPILLAVVFYYI